MTFDQWYNEIEGYGTRADRFDEWMSSSGDGAKGKDWLKAAYNAGFKEGSKQPVPLTITTPPHIKYPTPSNPNPVPPPFTPNPWFGPVRNCSRCGINLTGVMGYVCSDQLCPTFKHTWSGTITSGDTGPYFGGSSSAAAMGSTGSYYIVSDIKR